MKERSCDANGPSRVRIGVSSEAIVTLCKVKIAQDAKAAVVAPPQGKGGTREVEVVGSLRWAGGRAPA